MRIHRIIACLILAQATAFLSADSARAQALTKTLITGSTPGAVYVTSPELDYRRLFVVQLNGQIRIVSVRDHAVTSNVVTAERADTSKPGQVPAPFAGVVTLTVGVGDAVTAGQPVATIEAMKMEAAITAPVTGTVERLAIGHAQAVEGGDLLLVIG